MQVEHYAVGGRGRVERYLLAHGVCRSMYLCVRSTGGEEDGQCHLEVGPTPAALLQADGDSRDHDLSEVAVGDEGMADDAVADLACHFRHAPAQCGQVDARM